MSMKAHIRTDSLGNITIHMKGNLDFENNVLLKEELTRLMQENPLSKITIDMNHLDFVGSSGIGIFLQNLENLNKKKEQIKISNVKSEFMAVFRLHDDINISKILEDFDNDEDTENLSTKYALRDQTFEN